MGKFLIQSHGRLQEWVAEEKGYFKDEGLDYEFLVKPIITWSAHVQAIDSVPAEIQRGAFESIEEGRGCNLSAACHWTVNMAASGGHGKMWGHAYSISPSGIFVPPESSIQKPEDLANVPVTVGYHSGSHFSTLQGLEKSLKREEIKLHFAGLLLDRLADIRRFGPGERLVFEPYPREVFERTRKWIESWNLFPPEQAGSAGYESSVV